MQKEKKKHLNFFVTYKDKVMYVPLNNKHNQSYIELLKIFEDKAFLKLGYNLKQMKVMQSINIELSGNFDIAVALCFAPGFKT